MEQSPQDEQPGGDERYLNRCAFHPGTATGLACGKCGNYICTQCVIQTPVGARCRNCARVTTLPTFDVQPSYYARAVLAGGITAVVLGVFMLVIRMNLGWVPFLYSLLTLGVGYAVGEAISTAPNRKRGQGAAGRSSWSSAQSSLHPTSSSG
ncbi:MAG: hypothetical protein J4G01_02605 [Dehalococcoidia bacterium]|nr:hypothetical protein [Dehalococcoidia bacterium]